MPSKKRVLVAEGQHHIARLVQVTLERSGRHVRVAADGAEALGTASEFGPDLIVVSAHLPALEDFMRGVEADPVLRGVPVIMIGHGPEDDDARQRWSSRVRQYLAKPFGPRTLLEATRSILEGIPVSEPVGPSVSISLPRHWPLWFGPAVMALVGWIGSVHQPGPLFVYPDTRTLPLAWYLLEQALAVGITLAALTAGAAVVSGRLLPYRLALQTVCDARFLLALAAAFVSHSVMHAFVPGKILDLGGPHGITLHLAPFQILWLVVVTLAVASLLLRVALGYFRLLSTAIACPLPCLCALFVSLILGEFTAQMVSRLLFRLLLWPP